MALDARIEVIREKFGLSKDDFWELPQKRGTWIAKHAALEVAAAKASIRFDMPQVLEARGADGVCAVCVQGQMEDRFEWSIGEASPKNNKNAYPWAMAEKRAKDRVILKLIGIHGLVYSEEEADDFKGAGEFSSSLPKKDSREIYAAVTDALRKAGNDGKAALRAYWTSPEFLEAFEVMPPDWKTLLVEEKDAFLASYAKPAGRVDPNQSLDRQYAETVGGPQ